VRGCDLAILGSACRGADDGGAIRSELRCLQGGSELLVAPVIPAKVEVGWDELIGRP
jgi:hypothetical protein